jgi:hypothetical protein
MCPIIAAVGALLIAFAPLAPRSFAGYRARNILVTSLVFLVLDVGAFYPTMFRLHFDDIVARLTATTTRRAAVAPFSE